MSDYRLQVFRAIAEAGSLSGAARQLHLSQPAVTQHVKQLEEAYGVSLLIRSPEGISLTAAGEELFLHARRVGALESEVVERIGRSRGTLAGSLRLGASLSIADYYIAPLLGAFLAEHPEVTLSLVDGNTEEIVGALLARRIDLGLVEGICRRRDVNKKPFFEDEIVCVAAPGHPAVTASAVRPLTPAALRAHPFLIREAGSGTREHVERALRRVGLRMAELRVVAEVANGKALRGLALAGLGLCFLSRTGVEEDLAAGTLREVRVRGLRIVRPFVALYPQGPVPGGPAGAFLRRLLDRA